jgi:hypothetical protein
MRQNKEIFTDRTMQIAKPGKVFGDIERVLISSTYAKYPPMGMESLKEKRYPFTGVFISQTLVTLALVRFLLKGSFKDYEYLVTVAIRLAECLNFCKNSLKEKVISNQRDWNEYNQTLKSIDLSSSTKMILSHCILILTNQPKEHLCQ